MNELNSPRALKTRFPYMFAGPNIGFSFARGWMPILAWACTEIDAVLRDDTHHFRWTHIGEKFGAARLLYAIDSATSELVDVGTLEQPLMVQVDRAPTEPVVLAVAAIVVKTVEATRTTCCVCGAAALARPPLQRHMPPTLCVLHRSDPALVSAARITEGSNG